MLLTTTPSFDSASEGPDFEAQSLIHLPESHLHLRALRLESCDATNRFKLRS